MLEKNKNAMDCVEFVQYMHSISLPKRDTYALKKSNPLSELLYKRIEGKHIVLFYFSEKNFMYVQEHYAEYIRTRLEYLRESLSGIPDIFLWWYDDGLLSRLVDRLHHDSRNAEAEALESMYRDEQQLYIEGENSWCDSSLDKECAFAWADVYLGDDYAWHQFFLSKGKTAVYLDYRSLADGVKESSIGEWLDKSVLADSYAPMPQGQEYQQAKIIVLYYLPVAALLHYGEKAIENVDSVARFAYEQDGTLLWWLYDTHIDELIPCLPGQLQQKYKEACDLFSNSGGLLDKSGNIARAIKYADAYYMDSTRSAAMFNCINKPLMIPSWSLLSNFYYIRLRLMAVHMGDEYIYFVPAADRGTFLGKMRLDDGSVDIKLLRDEAGQGYMTKFMGAIAAENKLCIYPLYGEKYDEFIIYNPKDDAFDVLKISNILGGTCCPPPRSFRSVCNYRGKLFAVTWSWPRIVVIDLVSKAVNCIDMQKAIEESEIPFDGGAGLHLSCILKGHFYALYYNNDIIFDIDADKQELAKIRRINNDMQVRLLETDGEHLWLGAADGRIAKYDVRTGNCRIYQQRMPLYKGEQYFCNGYMIYYEGALYFFSTYISLEPECLYTKFDMHSGRFTSVEVIDNVGWLNNIVRAGKSKLLISSKYANADKVFLLDLPTMKLKEWTIKLSQSQEYEIKQQILQDYHDMGLETIQEGVDDITIKDMVEYCMASKNTKTESNNGKAIYDYIVNIS